MINGKIEEPTDPFHFFLLLLLPLDFAFCATFVDMNNWTDTNSFAFLFIMYVKKVALSYPLRFFPRDMILGVIFLATTGLTFTLFWRFKYLLEFSMVLFQLSIKLSILYLIWVGLYFPGTEVNQFSMFSDGCQSWKRHLKSKNTILL